MFCRERTLFWWIGFTHVRSQHNIAGNLDAWPNFAERPLSASLRNAAKGSEIGVLSIRTLHREFGSTILTVSKSPKNSSYFVAILPEQGSRQFSASQGILRAVCVCTTAGNGGAFWCSVGRFRIKDQCLRVPGDLIQISLQLYYDWKWGPWQANLVCLDMFSSHLDCDTTSTLHLWFFL